MVVVEKLPVGQLVAIFLFYIVSHAGIGWYANKLKKEYVGKTNDEELKKQVKLASIVFKWYPFIFVLGILILWVAI